MIYFSHCRAFYYQYLLLINATATYVLLYRPRNLKIAAVVEPLPPACSRFCELRRQLRMVKSATGSASANWAKSCKGVSLCCLDPSSFLRPPLPLAALCFRPPHPRSARRSVGLRRVFPILVVRLPVPPVLVVPLSVAAVLVAPILVAAISVGGMPSMAAIADTLQVAIAGPAIGAGADTHGAMITGLIPMITPRAVMKSNATARAHTRRVYVCG
jgi:hypothetical protein